MSGRAIRVLGEVDCIAGYSTYIELIKDLVKDKKTISTGMIKAADHLDQAEVGMQTVVFIGSSTSLQYMGFLLTPRGYSKKYTFE